MRGWPPHEVVGLGDWLLRASDGVSSGRANSALPLGDPGVDLPAALDQVEDFYAARSLDALLAAPRPGSEEVAALAARRGWSAGHDIHVLAVDLDRVPPEVPAVPGDVAVRLDDAPDEEWFLRSRTDVEVLGPGARRLVAGGDRPRVFASVRDRRGRALAVARGVLSDGWLGLFSVETHPDARRRGLASALVAQVLAWGRPHGAGASYLQVRASNHAAAALYDGLGYRRHHTYRYLTAPPR